MKYIFSVVFIVLIFSACSNQGNKNKSTTEVLPFFDLKDYISQESSRLDKQSLLIEKVIGIDGENETINPSEIDWKEELSIFGQCDINRKDWFDKYTVDSIMNGNHLVISYTTNNPKLKTKSLRVTFKEESVQEIEISREIKSIVNKSEELLTYSPRDGYQLNRKQKTPFSAEKSYIINTSFKSD